MIRSGSKSVTKARAASNPASTSALTSALGCTWCISGLCDMAKSACGTVFSLWIGGLLTRFGLHFGLAVEQEVKVDLVEGLGVLVLRPVTALLHHRELPARD